MSVVSPEASYRRDPPEERLEVWGLRRKRPTSKHALPSCGDTAVCESGDAGQHGDTDVRE